MSRLQFGWWTAWSAWTALTVVLAARSRRAEWFRSPERPYGWAVVIQCGAFVFGATAFALSPAETLVAALSSIGFFVLAAFGVLAGLSSLGGERAEVAAQRKLNVLLAVGAVLPFGALLR